jgi:predicted ribosome quality control (RQC) complex YloA/Tae2 family protein
MANHSSYTQTVVCEIKQIPDSLKDLNGNPAVSQITDPHNLASSEFLYPLSIDLFEEILSEIITSGANRIAFDRNDKTGEYIFTGLKCEPDLSEDEATQKVIEDLEYTIDKLKSEANEHEEFMNLYRKKAEEFQAELQSIKEGKTKPNVDFSVRSEG